MAQIQDGAGGGKWLKVNEENRALVTSVNQTFQNHHSMSEGEAFQALGTATLANATVPVLHLKNTSDTLYLVVTHIRAQLVDAAGGTAYPNASNYWSIRHGRTYSSGGSAITPVNMNTGSTKTAPATVYDSSPTLAGTANEFDREYLKAEAEVAHWNKEGALVIAPGGTLEASIVGDHTSGTAKVRISFVMADKTEFE